MESGALQWVWFISWKTTGGRKWIGKLQMMTTKGRATLKDDTNPRIQNHEPYQTIPKLCPIVKDIVEHLGGMVKSLGTHLYEMIKFHVLF